MKKNITSRVKRGLPVIGAAGLEWPGYGGPALKQGPMRTVLVPSEQVLLSSITLPLASSRQRLTALPFAFEGLLAEPIADVHTVLGPLTAPKTFLSAAVRHDTMMGWIASLRKSGFAAARLLPDALTVPRPDEGKWTVWTRSGRSLVRCSDGSGFAVPVSMLEAAWKAAGSPAVLPYGDSLPGGLSKTTVLGEIPPRKADPLAMAFNLRQGRYAIGAERTSSGWLRAAAILLIAGAAGQSAIAAADLSSLKRVAGEKRVEAARLLDDLRPGASQRGDVVGQLARLLPTDARDTEGQFLPVFARTASALGGLGAPISIKSLTYSEDDGALSIVVEATDLAALQRIEAALSQAGLAPEAGASTTGNGAAEARITLRAMGAS